MLPSHVRQRVISLLFSCQILEMNDKLVATLQFRVISHLLSPGGRLESDVTRGLSDRLHNSIHNVIRQLQHRVLR